MLGSEPGQCQLVRFYEGGMTKIFNRRFNIFFQNRYIFGIVSCTKCEEQSLWIRKPFVPPTGPRENKNARTQTLLKMDPFSVSLLPSKKI